MIVPPGLSSPLRSASSIMRTAIRSLMELPGLKVSSLARTVASITPRVIALIRTMGVRPMAFRIVSATGGITRGYYPLDAPPVAPSRRRRSRHRDSGRGGWAAVAGSPAQRLRRSLHVRAVEIRQRHPARPARDEQCLEPRLPAGRTQSHADPAGTDAHRREPRRPDPSARRSRALQLPHRLHVGTGLLDDDRPSGESVSASTC